jgi:glycosyl transferase family 25
MESVYPIGKSTCPPRSEKGQMARTSVHPIPVYVISLDRSADRFSSFLERNSHLPGIIRARAVDGTDLAHNDLVARGILSRDLGYTHAALGCAMSHACVWQIASGMDEPLTVAEDDAVFRRDFPAAEQGLIAALPRDWDLVLWGWNFDSALCVDLLPNISPCLLLCDQTQLRQNIAQFQLCNLPIAPFRLLRSHGIPGYSVSRPSKRWGVQAARRNGRRAQRSATAWS